MLAAKLPKEKFLVDSAGTSGWHAGEQPDKRSIATAKNHGVDISKQRARQFKVSDFDTFDYIFVMDNSNKKDVLQLAKTDAHRHKVALILNELYPNENVDVPDPYYGGIDGFEKVYQMLDQATTLLADKLKR